MLKALVVVSCVCVMNRFDVSQVNDMALCVGMCSWWPHG